MSKRQLKVDTNQLSLLDLIKQAQESEDTPTCQGSLNIEATIRQALSDAVKTCPLSIHQIAGEMSHLLGETITAEMIYSWTAESKTRHQIWSSRLAAFCRVTGRRRPLELVNEAAGMFCLPGPEALRAEIQKLREEEQRASRERPGAANSSYVKSREVNHDPPMRKMRWRIPNIEGVHKPFSGVQPEI